MFINSTDYLMNAQMSSSNTTEQLTEQLKDGGNQNQYNIASLLNQSKSRNNILKREIQKLQAENNSMYKNKLQTLDIQSFAANLSQDNIEREEREFQKAKKKAIEKLIAHQRHNNQANSTFNQSIGYEKIRRQLREHNNLELQKLDLEYKQREIKNDILFSNKVIKKIDKIDQRSHNALKYAGMAFAILMFMSNPVTICIMVASILNIAVSLYQISKTLPERKYSQLIKHTQAEQKHSMKEKVNTKEKENIKEKVNTKEKEKQKKQYHNNLKDNAQSQHLNTSKTTSSKNISKTKKSKNNHVHDNINPM